MNRIESQEVVVKPQLSKKKEPCPNCFSLMMNKESAKRGKYKYCPNCEKSFELIKYNY